MNWGFWNNLLMGFGASFASCAVIVSMSWNVVKEDHSGR